MFYSFMILALGKDLEKKLPGAKAGLPYTQEFLTLLSSPPALNLVAWPLASGLFPISLPPDYNISSLEPGAALFWDPNILGYEKWAAPGGTTTSTGKG